MKGIISYVSGKIFKKFSSKLIMVSAKEAVPNLPGKALQFGKRSVVIQHPVSDLSNISDVTHTHIHAHTHTHTHTHTRVWQKVFYFQTPTTQNCRIDLGHFCMDECK